LCAFPFHSKSLAGLLIAALVPPSHTTLPHTLICHSPLEVNELGPSNPIQSMSPRGASNDTRAVAQRDEFNFWTGWLFLLSLRGLPVRVSRWPGGLLSVIRDMLLGRLCSALMNNVARCERRETRCVSVAWSLPVRRGLSEIPSRAIAIANLPCSESALLF